MCCRLAVNETAATAASLLTATPSLHSCVLLLSPPLFVLGIYNQIEKAFVLVTLLHVLQT